MNSTAGSRLSVHSVSRLGSEGIWANSVFQRSAKVTRPTAASVPMTFRAGGPQRLRKLGAASGVSVVIV